MAQARAASPAHTTPEPSQRIPEPRGYEWIRSAFTDQPPALDFVLPGFLLGSVGALISPGGTGKSWLALEIAVALASGIDIAGLWTQAPASLSLGSTVYLAAEDPPEIIAHRLHALGAHLSGPERDAVSERVRIVTLVGAASHVQLINDNGIPNGTAIHQLERWATGRRLVILDTIRRFHGANESSSQSMSALLDCLERCATTTKAAILYLHHANKFAIWNNRTDEATASRGSSVLTEHVRWQAALTEDKAHTQRTGQPRGTRRTSSLIYSITKTNYGSPPQPCMLRRTSHGVLVASQRAPAASQESTDDLLAGVTIATA